MAQVIAVLGSPDFVNLEGSYEVWQYELSRDKMIFVVFDHGFVYTVKFENGLP